MLKFATQPNQLSLQDMDRSQRYLIGMRWLSYSLPVKYKLCSGSGTVTSVHVGLYRHKRSLITHVSSGAQQIRILNAISPELNALH